MYLIILRAFVLISFSAHKPLLFTIMNNFISLLFLPVNMFFFFFFPTTVKSWLIGKDSDAGRDLGQEEKGTTEDEMAGWHHWLDGRDFEWTPGVGDGQGGLACYNSWGSKESDMTEWLNWTELNWKRVYSYCFFFFTIHTIINLVSFLP